MKSIEITVFGKVQGVFFRSGCQSIAQQLGLVGFVQNNPDGTVTIQAKGPKKKITELVNWAKNGPKYADVQRVETQSLQDLNNPSLNAFVVL